MTDTNSFGEGFSQPFQSQYDFDLDHRPIQQPDKFKPMIVQLAQALRPEDVNSLRFCYKHLLKASGSQMNDALDILENLEENGLFTCSNLAPLVDLLKDIQRHDLVSTVENFQSTLLNQSLSTAEVSQPIPVGPPRSLSFPATSANVNKQKLTSKPEEESLGLNEEHTSEEVAAFMVAGTYSLTKSFKQGSVPISEAHNKEVQSCMSHQPVSHIQPATIQKEAIVHSFPPPQQQGLQTAQATSGPLFHIPDSGPENSASVGSLQDVIPDLENPPAEVKSKPASAMGGRERLPAVQPPPSTPASLNTSYAVAEPGAAPMEGAGSQVNIERSTSSLSDASTQTILKGSPLKQDKWMSRSPVRKFDLDRKKLYSMIGNHDFSHYRGRSKFKFPVPCENGSGPTVSLKIFPFCYDQQTHMAVQVKAKFSSKSRNPMFVNDLCYCMLRVVITPHHLQGAPLAETSELEIPLTPKCYEFKKNYDNVLSHIKIFYCQSDIITLHVQAFLECSEMFETTVEGEGVDAADTWGYVLVKKHQPTTDQYSASPCGGQN